MDSLGPVVNIVALFFSSNANIVKIKRIKRYHIKGTLTGACIIIGSSLLSSINIDIFTKERKNKRGENMIGLEPRLTKGLGYFAAYTHKECALPKIRHLASPTTCSNRNVFTLNPLPHKDAF